MLTFSFLVDSREAFLRAASLVHAKWRQAAKRIVVANEPATKMPSSRAVRRISGSHGWRSLHGSLPEKHFRAIRLSCPRWSSRPPDVSSRTRGPSAWHSARATGRLRLATGALRILTTAWIRETVRSPVRSRAARAGAVASILSKEDAHLTGPLVLSRARASRSRACSVSAPLPMLLPLQDRRIIMLRSIWKACRRCFHLGCCTSTQHISGRSANTMVRCVRHAHGWRRLNSSGQWSVHK